MVVFPNGKINLGLNVTHKREDGYHNIETFFYPIALTDALEIIQNQTTETSLIAQPKHTSDSISNVLFTNSGLPIQGNSEDNLCVKAYFLLQKDFPQLPKLAIHLHKVIPMGAGLGGGSSDGAFALTLINQICQLELSTDALKKYALLLGSDCPFFISNKPCFASGRGEIMQEVPLQLSEYEMVIVHPGIHVSTAEAFAKITPRSPIQSILKIITQPIPNWKDRLINDFEEGVFELFPAMSKIKSELYSLGATYASMSGTGSSLYGIFKKGQMPNLAKKLNYPISIIN